jgi:hypothetical protein
MEYITTQDWYEQLIATVARVKAFFGYSKDKQDELIQFTDAHQAHTEQTSEGTKETELYEAWDFSGILTLQQMILQQNARQIIRKMMARQIMRKMMAPNRGIFVDRGNDGSE